MKPAPFDYLRAASVQEAAEILAQYGGRARILAGGQSLLALLNIRLAEPDLLVDISNIDALRQIRIDGDFVEVGAAVVQADLLAWPSLEQELPLLALALPHVGHFQTRNRGTVGGSIAHADPSSELPLCLATLAGEVELRSTRGTRRIAAAAFQTGMLATARAPEEVLVAVRFPRRRPGEGFAFREVARRHGDFAIVALAAKADGARTLLGVGGLADRPTVRDIGQATGEALAAALNDFAWSLGGADDIHATARYRRELVRRLGPQVIEEARQCRS
jgi:2-furoyl-CoA dehydrogenase FAD binding subunit